MSIPPPALKKGDTIGVFAPSSVVNKQDIEKSKAIIENAGFSVFIHPQTYEQNNQSAGTHLQKSLAFQGLWQRGDIKAIWAAGGGNRCMHLIETINFKKLSNNPKLLIGFSDVTALLNAVYSYTEIITVHGPVFKNLHSYKQIDHLLKLLQGKSVEYPVKKANIYREGMAEGKMVGGNLSLFHYLPSVLPKKLYEGSILFLEDCNEEISRIDRMFLHLKQLGVLSEIKGLVLGEFSDLKDTGTPYGFTMNDIIAEHTENLNIPILKDMPFGHGKNLYSFPIGAKAKIDTKKMTFKIKETAVTSN